jgi:hypothetical protein
MPPLGRVHFRRFRGLRKRKREEKEKKEMPFLRFTCHTHANGYLNLITHSLLFCGVTVAIFMEYSGKNR